MGTSLIFIILAILCILQFMSVITLKKKLESIQREIDKQKDYWRSVEYSLEIKSNKISKEFQENAQFSEKGITHLSERVNEISKKIDKSTRDINFITKQEALRVITTPLKVTMTKPNK